jgi:P-type Cu+ transporter
MKKFNLTIQGMHCASCSANVERSIKKIPGVKTVSISVLMKKGTVEADDSVTKEQLKAAVSKAGYEAISII